MRKLILALVALGVCLSVKNTYAEGIDEHTVLMLHFNGTDGSTDFVDSSSSNHSVTANGNVQIDTAQSKFAGASALFDGDGDYLSLADHTDWAFSSGDFTVDCWVKFNDAFTPQFIWGQYVDALHASYLYVARAVNGALAFTWKIGDGEFAADYLSDAIIWDANWHHIAIVRNGNNFYMFKDGISLSLTAYTPAGDLPDFASNLYIGQRGNNTGYINGWLDELRISKGIARWTSDFTPPTAEYDTIPNTPPLAHAGIDAEARVGEEVTLDGRYSYDPDGQIVSWVWRSLSDPQKAIVAEGELTTMNAHGYAEELVELTVTDNRGDIATDTMKVTNPAVIGPVGPQGPPGIAPEEVTSIQDQITTLEQQDNILQQQDSTLQQQNANQQLRLEQDRYLLEQLPQLQKKIEGLETQAQ